MTDLRAASEAADYESIDIERIQPGTILSAPILDDRDVLLLAQGQTVTEAFLQKLRDRKVKAVRIHGRDAEEVRFAGAGGLPDAGSLGRPGGRATDAPAERSGVIAPHRNGVSDRLDAEISVGRMQMPAQGDPILASLKRPGGRYDADVREQMVESYGRSARRMHRAYEALAAGRGADRAAMEEVATEAIAALAEDPDLFVGIAANSAGGGYPSRHSVHVAHLALSIGARLGLDESTVRELVLGCLVHDAGMLRLDRSLYDGPHPLDPLSFLEITKHPIYAFDLVKDVSVMPKRSAFIAYQIHERVDGSGYPRRRSGNQIHFLSKVAAVADVYVALVSPRPHRAAVMPYHAMERVLRDAGRGLFDRDAVRALLRTLSLFPIGSYVELSDGRQGRVLRAGDDYTKPVVEAFGAAGEGEVIDLAGQSLSIVRAIPVLANGAV